jgi:hypothetical protein
VTQRDRIVLLVVAAVVGLGAFYMLALKPKREEAAKLGQDVERAQKRVETAQADISAGEAARARYALNYTTVARLGKAVPTDDDVPSLVYQLDSTARSTGVDFRSVKLTSGTGTPPPPANAAQGAAATADNSKGGSSQGGEQKGDQSGGQPKSAVSGQSASQPASTPAAPTQAATAALPPGAVVGPAGLSTMPFTFTFEGNFFRLSEFMTRLERYIKPRRSGVDVRGRLLLINGITLNAANSGFPKMKASIAAQAYLLPADQGLFNGATPQSPAQPGAAQPASSNGAASPVAPATATP